jgi:MFS family permease
VQTYRALFAVREFRALFAQTALNVGAASVGSLALGTLTYAETGSPVVSAFVMFGGPLVRLATSWFLLSLADLWRPRAALTFGSAVTTTSFALQAIPDLPLAARFVLLVVPWIVLSAVGGSAAALVADVLPDGSYVFGRATINVAVGTMQIVGFSLGGVLLLSFSTGQLFLGAAAAALVALAVVRLGLEDRPPRAAGRAVSRSRAANRLLLRSPVLRPVYLALWVPNGLVVGCEALLVPYAGERAGFVFAAAAAGMLAGDVVMGRFVPEHLRDRLVEPLRFLLALPWLAFVLQPGTALACVLVALGSVGYCAGLPLQERLLVRTAPDMRGHVLGLSHLGMMAMQGVGALTAGLVAQALGADAHAAGQAIAVMAVASLCVTALLVPGLRRSRAGQGLGVVTLPPSRGHRDVGTTGEVGAPRTAPGGGEGATGPGTGKVAGSPPPGTGPWTWASSASYRRPTHPRREEPR